MNKADPCDTPPRPRLYWEDFPAGQVREFGAMTVRREDIVDFAGRFDPQPFHLDEAAADAHPVRRPGRQRLAHLRAGDAHDVRRLPARSASLGSPGVDSLRWLKPVRPATRCTCA